jgi:hypothetical protein
MLGLVECTEEEVDSDDNEGNKKRQWLYNLAPDFDRATLLAMAKRKIDESDLVVANEQNSRNIARAQAAAAKKRAKKGFKGLVNFRKKTAAKNGDAAVSAPH